MNDVNSLDYKALAASVHAQPGAKGGVVVIGNLDGVHRGHQSLLAEGRALANVLQAPLVVLTFDPHPRRFFSPEKPPFLLQDTVQKNNLLKKHGVDQIITLKFDRNLAALSAVDFVTDVLIKGLSARHVIVGNNFVFGAQRSGDVRLLQEMGRAANIGITALATIATDNNERIASQRIRDLLQQGDIATANELLGRPWSIRGEVVTGHQRGRTIGFPTANIAMKNYLHPRFGVYAAIVHDTTTHTTHRAIVNIGQRPTVDGVTAPLLEAHLLDFSGDLYGHVLEVELIGFIRPEQKFDGLDSLKEQIQKDCTIASNLLN